MVSFRRLLKDQVKTKQNKTSQKQKQKKNKTKQNKTKQNKTKTVDRTRLHRCFEILKYFCYFSYLLHNFVPETVVVEINVTKCLDIIYKHIAHTFIKLEVEPSRL